MTDCCSLRFLRTSPLAVLPAKNDPDDAGFDLSSVETFDLFPKERRLVDTGWKIAISRGYEGQVRPRSGNAVKKGLTVLNSPGTIDAGYRGPVKVLLINTSDDLIKISAGDRIAQLVIAVVPEVNPCEEVDEEVFSTLTSTRMDSGFGSSGIVGE